MADSGHNNDSARRDIPRGDDTYRGSRCRRLHGPGFYSGLSAAQLVSLENVPPRDSKNDCNDCITCNWSPNGDIHLDRFMGDRQCSCLGCLFGGIADSDPDVYLPFIPHLWVLHGWRIAGSNNSANRLPDYLSIRVRPYLVRDCLGNTYRDGNAYPPGRAECLRHTWSPPRPSLD